MKTFFIKTQYLYGKDAFFLYKPFHVPSDAIVEKNSDGKIRLIKTNDETITTHVQLTEIVSTFRADENNMLSDEYKPRFVSAVSNGFCKHIYHTNCEVLKQKRGSYTMLKCCTCGGESPIAINSFSLAPKFDDEIHTNCKH